MPASLARRRSWFFRACLVGIGTIGVAVRAGFADPPADAPAKPELPPIVAPGGTPGGDEPASAPADAVVLFDGSNLDRWQGSPKDAPAAWKLVEGKAMEIAPRAGSIRTKDSYGYGQYHFEFRTPPEAKGKGQGRGNSGIHLGGQEIQVLDSYENETYPDGQCGAIYGRHIPLVNASRPPGQWQTFDVIYHPPVLDADRKLLQGGSFTVLHNGVLIHDRVEIDRSTDPNRKGSISLQDHGNPVRYRNLWHRPWRPALVKAKPEPKPAEAKPVPPPLDSSLRKPPSPSER